MEADHNIFYRRVVNPNPITCGWAVSALLEIERKAKTAFLGPITASSNLRRATVFMLVALSAHPLLSCGETVTDTDRAFAGDIFRLKCEQLLFRCGLLVPGLLSALYRTDGEPLDSPEDYRRLLELLTSPDSKGIINALRHVNPLTSPALHAAKKLKFSYLTAELLGTFRSTSEVEIASEIISFVKSRCPDIAREQHKHQAAKNGGKSWVKWAQEVLLRNGSDFPHGPALDPEYFEQLTGKQMAEVGRTFQNCLRTKVLEAGSGSCAYFVAQTDPQSIIELRRLQVDGQQEPFWVLYAIHVAKNRPVPEHIEAELVQRLAVFGIGRLRHVTSTDVSRPLALRMGVIDSFSYS